ncbi:Ig-like domain-containing protein [Puniceicoccaceae bacterium K14]|nr:Ig-like domain-containing protein [Puniceicoccaceae bacterium K14]
MILLRTKKAHYLAAHLSLCISAILASPTVSKGGTFDITGYSGSGAILTEVEESVTATYAATGSNWTVGTASIDLTSGQSIRAISHNAATQFDLTFDKPINIENLVFYDDDATIDGTYTFKVTSGSGSTISLTSSDFSNISVLVDPSDWKNVSSFTITHSGGASSPNFSGGFDTINFTVNPSLSGLPSHLEANEDTESDLDLSSLVFTDPDSPTLTVTLSVSNGNFATPTDGASVGSGVIEARVDDTTLSLVGSPTDINSYLNAADAISWTPEEDSYGLANALLTFSANDGDGSGDITLGTVAIDVTGVDDPPTIAGSLFLQVTEETETDVDLSSFTISDIDTTGDLTITITSSDTGSVLTAADGSLEGVTATDNGNNGITLVGTTSELNAYLSNDTGHITYTTSVDRFYTYDQLSIQASDGVGTPNQASTIGFYVDPLNNLPTGQPTITGTEEVYQTLNADVSSIDDADGIFDGSGFHNGSGDTPFSYQWTLNGENIPNATDSTYTLTLRDAGKKIGVDVSYVDQIFQKEGPVSSSPTSIVALSSQNLTADLLGHWSFDTNSDDESGNDYDGVLSNGATIDLTAATNNIGTGKLSLEADNNEFLDLTQHKANLGSLAEGTIALWFRTSSSETTQTLFCATSATDSSKDWKIVMLADGTLQVQLSDQATFSTPFAADDDNWRHLAVSVATNEHSLYIDGRKVASSDLTYTIGDDTVDAFISAAGTLSSIGIGSSFRDEVSQPFDGLIDDLRIYDASPAASIIAELAELQTPRNLSVSTTQYGGLTGGSNVYLKVDDGAAVLGGRTAITFEFRFATTDLGDDLAGYRGGGPNDSFYLYADDEYGLSVLLNGLYITFPSDGLENFEDGSVRTLSITSPGDYTPWKAYNNGVQATEEFVYYPKTFADNGTLTFLGSPSASGEVAYPSDTLDDTLYEIRIFEDVRTVEEMQANLDGPISRNTAGLIASWDFQSIENGGVITEKVSGNNLRLFHSPNSDSLTLSHPELFLTIPENSANDTEIGSIRTSDSKRDLLIATLLLADSDLHHDPVSNKFYKASSTAETWANAQATAIATTLNSLPGQLLTIGSAHENQFAQDLADETFGSGWTSLHLGASDQDEEGEWFWYTGSSPDSLFWNPETSDTNSSNPYSNWDESDPDNTGEAEHFATLLESNGKWNDRSGTPTYHTFIEWDVDAVLQNAGNVGQETIAYTIANQSETGAFEIDSESGVITVSDSSKLDFETLSTHTLTIAATDKDGRVTSQVFSIEITDENDAPTLTGTPTVITTDEDTASDFDLSAIDLFDADGDTLNITLDVSSGTLAATSTSEIAVTGSGTNSLTLSGLEADIETFLNDVSIIQYTGAQDVSGTPAATFTLQLEDGTSSATPAGGNVNISEVNDPATNFIVYLDPDLGGGELPGRTVTINQGSLWYLYGTLSVTDVDDGNDLFGPDAEQVGDHATFETFDFGSWILQINQNISQLRDGETAQDYFYIESYDSTLSGFTVNYVGINDEPSLTDSPTDLDAVEETRSNIDFSSATFVDPDAESSLTVTLTASSGILTATSNGDVTATGSDANELILSGTIDNINTYLDTVSAIQYTGATDIVGDNAATITVTGNDGDGSGDIFFATINLDIANINDAPSGSPMINGITMEDELLTAESTSLSDGDGLGTLAYQWQRNNVDISGANNSSYTLTQADVGTSIRVVASYTDDQGTEESVSSPTTEAIANVNDDPTGTVSISGTPTEDETLTASNTLADEDGLGTISYQWQRDSVDISGATGSSYTLAQADVDSTIQVVANYTDDQGTEEFVASLATANIANINDAPTGAVSISGTPSEYQTLTAANTLADEDGIGAISYQWQRNQADIPGATGTSYALTQTDIGNRIRVTASYTDDFGQNEGPIASTETARIENTNDVPIAFDDTVLRHATDSIQIPFANLLANDTDEDEDTLTIVAIEYTENNGGAIELSETHITYDPLGFIGIDSFTYTVEDPVGAQSTALVTIGLVIDEGDAPIISSIEILETGNLRILFRGFPGQTYRIEESDDLFNWTNWGTITAEEDGYFECEADLSDEFPSTFFRSVKPEAE